MIRFGTHSGKAPQQFRSAAVRFWYFRDVLHTFGETCSQTCQPEVITASSTTLNQLVPARLLVGVGSATGGTVGTATTAYTMDVVGKFPEHSGVLFGAIQVLARIH